MRPKLIAVSMFQCLGIRERRREGERERGMEREREMERKMEIERAA